MFGLTTLLSPSDLGLWIVLRTLGMGLPFLVNFGHHRLLFRRVRDMATLYALIAARLPGVRHTAGCRLHVVENVKLMTITVQTLQGQSSVHAPSLLCVDVRFHDVVKPLPRAAFANLAIITFLRVGNAADRMVAR